MEIKLVYRNLEFDLTPLRKVKKKYLSLHKQMYWYFFFFFGQYL